MLFRSPLLFLKRHVMKLWPTHNEIDHKTFSIQKTSVEVPTIGSKLRKPRNEVPPLKWSILRYGFSKEDHDGKKETYG